MQSIRRQLTYANVVATMALFLALGGSAYAFHLGKNSVKSRNIARGAVKTSDIHNGAVSKAKLKTDAISSNAIADGSIGAKQLGNVVVRFGQFLPLNDGSNAIPVAVCQPGERALSGGGRSFVSNDPGIGIASITPVKSASGTGASEGEAPTGVAVELTNGPGGSGNTQAQAFVYCLQ